MRCPRCNVAIPDGSEVCPECGCYVHPDKTGSPQLAGVSPDTHQKPKRSWLRRLFSVLAVVAIVAIARYIGTMAGRQMARTMSEPDGSRQIAVQETVNPAFEAYLTQRGVAYECMLQGSECVILELEGDYFEVLEYGHIGDRLTEFYETIYLSMEGYSADEEEIFKSNARSLFGQILNPLYTSMDEDVQGDYLLLQIHWENLDDENVIQEITEDGFASGDQLQGETLDFLSLEETLEEVLAKGGIQR